MNKRQNRIYNELISKYNFDEEQIEQIKLGLRNNLNVNIYANPKFSSEQMREIRQGLNYELDVSIYAKPEFNAGQRG